MLLLYIACFYAALLLHELGHLMAAIACEVPVKEFGIGWGPKLFQFNLRGLDFKLHALPLGAYVRLDVVELQRRRLSQQVLVLLAGVSVNIVTAALVPDSPLAMMNLLLAATNILPLYQQDGWKCGMVIMRALLKRKSSVVEWTFTITGTGLSVALIALLALRHI